MLTIYFNFSLDWGRKGFDLKLFNVYAPNYLKNEVHQALVGETDYNGVFLDFSGLIKGSQRRGKILEK